LIINFYKFEGEWSFQAQRYLSENLNGQNVYVCFLSEQNIQNEYDVVIYVTAASKTVTGHPSSHYVKLSDLLNDAGLALKTESKQGLQLLEANKFKSSKISMLEPLNTNDYPDPILPKIITKDLQNSYDVTYDAIVSYVAKYDRKKGVFYVQLIKITKVFETLVEMRESLDAFYGTLNDNLDLLRFPESFLKENLMKRKHLAGVCKLNDHFYRCSIIKMIDTKYLVKLVDYGDKKEVDHENVFRPLEKYIKLERQAFKMKLDGECKQEDKAVS